MPQPGTRHLRPNYGLALVFFEPILAALSNPLLVESRPECSLNIQFKLGFQALNGNREIVTLVPACGGAYAGKVSQRIPASSKTVVALKFDGQDFGSVA